MIVPTFVFVVLGVIISSSYGRRVPVRDVSVSDHGLVGFVNRPKNNPKSGSLQGHNVEKRSPHGSYVVYDYADTNNNNNFNDEVFTGEESKHGGYVGYHNGFHSFSPYPPQHHGPHPGAYPPPFSQHEYYPGYYDGDGWNSNFGNKPCNGHGCGYGPNGQGHGHGHGHGHGFKPGNGHGHGHGHGQGQGNGKGHGNGCHIPPGHAFGHGKGHGHGHGQGHKFDCDYDESNEEGNESVEVTPTTEYVPPVNPTQTVPTVTRPTPPPTRPTPIPTTGTTEPVYDIDVRLGSSDRK